MLDQQQTPPLWAVNRVKDQRLNNILISKPRIDANKREFKKYWRSFVLISGLEKRAGNSSGVPKYALSEMRPNVIFAKFFAISQCLSLISDKVYSLGRCSLGLPHPLRIRHRVIHHNFRSARIGNQA